MRRRVIITALSTLEAVALAPSHNRRAVLSLPFAAAPVVPLAAVSAAAARPRRVLVAGASGRSGRECVRALDGDERYTAVPLVRSLERWRVAAAAAGLEAPGRTVVEADVTAPPTLDRALKGIDDVICDVGFVPTFDAEADRRAALDVDRDGVVAFVEAAERAKLPGRFVLVYCAVRRFPGPAAEACLARRRVKVVTFLGDSLVRDAWAAFGRRLNITVNERKVRARRFAGAASTVASAKGIRVHFSQIWGLDGLWRCGLLPRSLNCAKIKYRGA